MKKIKNFLFLSTLIIFISCDKTEKIAVSKTEIANSIAKKESFTEFTKQFIINFTKISKINNSNVIHSNYIESTISNQNQDSLIFEQSIVFKNRIDNQCLNLLHDNPILIDMDSTDVEEIIKDAIDIKLAMTDLETLQMKLEVNNELNEIMDPESEPNSMEAGNPGLTIDEVWDCFKRSLGIGSGSILTIAGLQKLATEGVQQVVISLSKWLAKRAGWIGVIVTLIDFSSCLYAELND